MVSIIVILIPVLIAVIIILAVGLSYKKRLSNAVNGEENVHSRGVSPTEILPWILVFLLLIWNAISLTMTTQLTREISGLESQMLSHSTTLQQEIFDIKNSMENSVANVNVEILNMDKETLSVVTHVTVAPKAYGDDTTVTFTHGSETVELKKDGSMFEGDVQIGLFERDDAYVTITTAGVSQVRMVDGIATGMLWMDFLPQPDTQEMDVHLSYNSDSTPKELYGKVAYSTMFMKEMVQPTKAYLVIEQNGKVLKTIDLEACDEMSRTIEIKEPLSIEDDNGLSISIVVENEMGLKVKKLFWYMTEGNENTPALQVLDQNDNALFLDY